jgi:eukaryotic-like serine/threonine-protein kinase
MCFAGVRVVCERTPPRLPASATGGTDNQKNLQAMSEFPDALKSFRDGQLSREDLLWDLERRLETGESQARTLLDMLEERGTRESLPRTLYAALRRRIRRWEAQAEFEAGYDPDRARAPPPAVPTGPSPVAVGSVLVGRFKLTELIAAGGMGAVYKAVDLRKVETGFLDCHVAVKVLAVQHQDFTRALALLQSEAHKLQHLPHPAIVRVMDCDRDGTLVFMTMEYLAGESLKSRLARRFPAGAPSDEVRRIVETLASALAFAHRNGIVHGDLKPENVIFTDSGEIKVIDFGISRLVPSPEANTTLEHEQQELHGLTPRYASPEMLEGQQADPRDDLYALACIAYELSTGRHPFADRSATQARDTGMEPVRHPNLSREQWRAIVHGLEFDRARRTPSTEVFLQEFTEQRRVSTRTRVALAVVLLALLCASYFLFRGQ